MTEPSEQLGSDDGLPDGFPDSAEDLLDLAAAFQKSRALLAACELDIFDAIGPDRVKSSEVAEKISADPGGTERLLHALCALGLLQKKDGLFSNSPVTSRYLLREGPEYVPLLFYAQAWDHWTYLPEAVRRGRPTVVRPFQDRPKLWVGAMVARMGRLGKRVWLVARRSDHWLRTFIDFMRAKARRRSAALVELLDLSGISRALDLGGGPAVYAMALARAKDDLQVTVVDLPTVVPTTRRNVAESGLSDRIEAIGGNILEDDLGTGYDLVLISETVHALSEPQSQRLVARSYDALNPGGRLVVHDFILDDDRTGPPFAALFSLDMLISTDGGDTYAQSDIRGWMGAAGFSRFEQMDTGTGTTFIIGHKPTG